MISYTVKTNITPKHTSLALSIFIVRNMSRSHRVKPVELCVLVESLAQEQKCKPSIL